MPPLEAAIADAIQAGKVSASMFSADPPRFALDFLTPAFDARATFTRITPAWRVNTAGQLVSTPAGSPRINFDPAGTLRAFGYLAEQQAQNPLTNSNALSDWTDTGTSRAANDALAPDGTLTATKVTETAATAQGHNLNSPAIAITGDLLYTFSCFVKMGTRARVSVALTGGSAFVGGNCRMRARFDNLTTTLIGGATAGGMIPYGNGWYRLWVQALAQSSPTGQGAKVYLTDDADAISYDGDTGKYVWAWGAQLEQGPLTSYIPTSGIAVTRAADLAVLDDLTPWFDGGVGPGTVLCEALWQVVPPTGGHYLWSIADASATNILGVYKSVTGSEAAVSLTSGGSPVNVAGLGAKAITAGVPFRHVLSWDGAGNMWDAANGVPGTPVIGASPGQLKKLAIGAFHSGSNYLNGHIRRFQYWPGAKSLAECRGMSLA